MMHQEHHHEHVIEMPVEVPVPVPVRWHPKADHRPRPVKIVERIVEKIVEVPIEVPVPYDVPVEVPVDRAVPVEIHVPVDRIVEVERIVYVDRPVDRPVPMGHPPMPLMHQPVLSPAHPINLQRPANLMRSMSPPRVPEQPLHLNPGTLPCGGPVHPVRATSPPMGRSNGPLYMMGAGGQTGCATRALSPGPVRPAGALEATAHSIRPNSAAAEKFTAAMFAAQGAPARASSPGPVRPGARKSACEPDARFSSPSKAASRAASRGPTQDNTKYNSPSSQVSRRAAPAAQYSSAQPKASAQPRYSSPSKSLQSRSRGSAGCDWGILQDRIHF